MSNKPINKRRLYACIIANAISLVVVAVLVLSLKDNSSKYFRYGPSDDLILISVRIDSWTKWCGTVILICSLRGVDVAVNELAGPILGFNIYNPDKKHIVDFTKNELNIAANSMWMINGLRGIVMLVINISQIDFALISVVFSEIVSFFIVRKLLSEKTFGPVNDGEDVELV